MKTEEREKRNAHIKEIKESLSGIPDFYHDKCVIKAMLLINEFQTQKELSFRSTLEQNGYGFNSVDGTIASSYCEQLVSKHWLSEKQLNVVRKIMKKYWKQLFNLSLRNYVSINANLTLDVWVNYNKSSYSHMLFHEYN